MITAELKQREYTHVIDWDKVDSFTDLIEILKGLEMTFDIKDCNKKLHPYLTPIESNK